MTPLNWHLNRVVGIYLYDKCIHNSQHSSILKSEMTEMTQGKVYYVIKIDTIMWCKVPINIVLSNGDGNVYVPDVPISSANGVLCTSTGTPLML